MIGKPDGSVQYIEKFAVRLSSNMQLRAFPFDSQDLEIYVHPFTGQVGRIVLSVDPASTGVSTALLHTSLPLWSTGRITYRTVLGSMPGEEASSKVRSHVVFAIHVTRNSAYYTFRIFIPLALMVAVSWGVFWIPADDLNSQLLISVTTVLTLVAFSVALSNILPPVPYLTFYDAFFLICFLFILLTIVEVLIAHTVHRRSVYRRPQDSPPHAPVPALRVFQHRGCGRYQVSLQLITAPAASESPATRGASESPLDRNARADNR